MTDTRDHKQLISCHLQNIRTALLGIVNASMADEFHIISRHVEPIIANAKMIDSLATELLADQAQGKEQLQCSTPSVKSASDSPS